MPINAESQVDQIATVARELYRKVGRPIRLEVYVGNGRVRVKVTDEPSSILDVARNHSPAT